VHDCKLDEQHGLVCRIHGLIEKKIDTIFEYQWHNVCKYKSIFSLQFLRVVDWLSVMSLSMSIVCYPANNL
jgi:hypothetical protein